MLKINDLKIATIFIIILSINIPLLRLQSIVPSLESYDLFSNIPHLFLSILLTINFIIVVTIILRKNLSRNRIIIIGLSIFIYGLEYFIVNYGLLGYRDIFLHAKHIHDILAFGRIISKDPLSFSNPIYMLSQPLFLLITGMQENVIGANIILTFISWLIVSLLLFKILSKMIKDRFILALLYIISICILPLLHSCPFTNGLILIFLILYLLFKLRENKEKRIIRQVILIIFLISIYILFNDPLSEIIMLTIFPSLLIFGYLMNDKKWIRWASAQSIFLYMQFFAWIIYLGTFFFKVGLNETFATILRKRLAQTIIDNIKISTMLPLPFLIINQWVKIFFIVSICLPVLTILLTILYREYRWSTTINAILFSLFSFITVFTQLIFFIIGSDILYISRAVQIWSPYIVLSFIQSVSLLKQHSKIRYLRISRYFNINKANVAIFMFLVIITSNIFGIYQFHSNFYRSSIVHSWLVSGAIFLPKYAEPNVEVIGSYTFQIYYKYYWHRIYIFNRHLDSDEYFRKTHSIEAMGTEQLYNELEKLGSRYVFISPIEKLILKQRNENYVLTFLNRQNVVYDAGYDQIFLIEDNK